MLIIDDKVAIIHVPKCGGTTVCRSLIDVLDSDRVEFFGYTKEGSVRSRESKKSGGLWKHSTTTELRDAVGPEKFSKLDIRCVSNRDPWTRVASFYHYALRHNQKNQKRYQNIAGLSFEQFVLQSQFPQNGIVEYTHDMKTGVRLTDKVLQFGDLNAEILGLAEELGVQKPILKPRNVSPESTDYFGMYTQQTCDQIAKVFQSEIDWFGHAGPDATQLSKA